MARRRSVPQGIDDLRAISPRGIMGDDRSPGEDHFRPDAQQRCAWDPGLLLGLQVQPLACDQRGDGRDAPRKRNAKHFA